MMIDTLSFHPLSLGNLKQVFSRRLRFGNLHLAFFILVAVLGIALPTWAGTGGTAFSDLWLTLKDWMQGMLGRVLAGAMILVGIVGGIGRQSLMSFAVGVGGGMGLYATPGIVETIMSVTLPVMISPTALPCLSALHNGLGG
jgi:conjugal transfer pilus assembly protein TraA